MSGCFENSSALRGRCFARLLAAKPPLAYTLKQQVRVLKDDDNLLSSPLLAQYFRESLFVVGALAMRCTPGPRCLDVTKRLDITFDVLVTFPL